MVLMQGSGESFQGYRLWLSQELVRRQSKNPSYSMTAFSRALGMSAPTLSQVMSGKRPLSAKAARRIAEKCGVSAAELQSFLFSSEDSAFENLELDKFQAISHWYYFAILSLAKMRGNRMTAEWVARQLGITRSEAQEALDRLVRLNLIVAIGRGFKRTAGPIWVPTENTGAIRKYHRETLEKALTALDEDIVPLELLSSITLVADEKRLQQARSLIKKFRDRLTSFLETGEGDRVFTLAVQLFPVSRKGDQ